MVERGKDAPQIGQEPGYRAVAALAHVHSRALAAIRARATFRPVHDHELVPVLPCTLCGDGGQRAVGRVRGRGHWQRVHACDTCGLLQLYEINEP